MIEALVSLLLGISEIGREVTKDDLYNAKSIMKQYIIGIIFDFFLFVVMDVIMYYFIKYYNFNNSDYGIVFICLLSVCIMVALFGFINKIKKMIKYRSEFKKENLNR